MLSQFYQKTALGLANNRLIKSTISGQAKRIGVSRFVAGENITEIISSLESLEAKGMNYLLSLLGEFVGSESSASEMTNGIIASLDYLDKHKKTGYMSLKPSQLGLGISYELAHKNALAIVEKAQESNAHICLDIENIPYVEGTLSLYKDLRNEGFDNVSTVLQSYLRRSMADLEDLLDLGKPTIRLVKGAYNEDKEVAYQRKGKIEENLLEMIFKGLENGAKINIATHDENILSHTTAFLRGAKLDKDSYEYQLLFGVALKLQERLQKDKHPVRIYVPFGEDWYGYFSRRLAERPENLAFVIRGLFS